MSTVHIFISKYAFALKRLFIQCQPQQTSNVSAVYAKYCKCQPKAEVWKTEFGVTEKDG